VIIDALVRLFIDAKLLDTELSDSVILLYSISEVPQDVNIYGLEELLNEYGIILLEYKYKDGILRIVLDDNVEAESYSKCGVVVEFSKLVEAIYDLREFVNDIILVLQEYSIEGVAVCGCIDVIIVSLSLGDSENFMAGMRQLGYVMKDHIVLSNNMVEVYFSPDGLPDRLRTVCG